MSGHIETLRQHNEWRRGAETLAMTHPKVLGEAIDATIAEVEALREQVERLRLLLDHSDEQSKQLGEMIKENERLRKGEYVCQKCGLRKNDDHPKGDF